MNALKTLASLSLALLVAGCPPAPKPDPIPPTPKILKFTATPTMVGATEKTTLAWEISDASSMTLVDVSRGPVAGATELTGSVDAVPGTSTLYVLSALNDRGARATAVVSVSVRGGSTASRILFAAVPATLAAGEKAVLVWAAEGASSVAIVPAGGTALDLKGQVQSGSVEVDPTDAETTYTLTADGQTRTTTVKRAPAITEVTASPRLVKTGDTVTIGWKSSWANKITVTSPGRGVLFTTTTAAEVGTGSTADTVPQLPQGVSLSYVVSAEGVGGTAELSTSVYVGGAPAITELKAPDYAKLGSTFKLSWKTTGADAVRLKAAGTLIYQTVSPAQAATGSVDLPTPAADTTYTLEAVSTPSGQSVSQTRTVQVVGAASVSAFTVTPGTIAAGGAPVTVTWNTPGARRLRIVESTGFVVYSATGASAETGTATAYPNDPAVSYLLDADNTLDPPVTADAGVTVTTQTPLIQKDGGLVFEAQGTVEVDWTVPNATLVGLPHSDVVTAAASTGFVDISTTGTKLAYTSLDDSVLNFTPQFQAFLFGQRVPARVNVSTNGFFTFSTTTPSSGATVGTFPSSTLPANYVAPYWADLYLDATTSGVYWQVVGDAPEQVLIVQWDKVKAKGQATSELTFEAKVRQTGVVTFEFKTLTTTASVTSVTGVQGPPGKGVTAAAAAGSAVELFGPKSASVLLSTSLLPISGFLKIGTGYMRTPLSNFVRATDLAISEAMYSPSAAVDAGEWFEVANNTAAPIELQGLEIELGTAPDGGTTRHTIASSLVVPANGVRVLGQTSDTLLNDGVSVNYAYGVSNLIDDATPTIRLLSGGRLALASTLAGIGAVGASAVLDPTPLLDSTGGFNTRLKCTAPATLTYGTQTPLQRGGPGVANGCFPRMSRIPLSFFDISTTGTALSPSSVDEGVVTVSLASNPITREGATIATVYASTNGWINSTATTSAGMTNKVNPTTSAPLGTMAVFWDDLRILTSRTGSGMFSKRVAAGEDSNNPAPHWIIQWQRVEHYGASDDLTFQVKLFDSGIIEYHYATMTSGSSSNYANGNSATVWLENTAGTAALPFSINQPSITSNMALRYAP